MLILTPQTLKGTIQGKDTPVEFHLGWRLLLLSVLSRNASGEWGVYVGSTSLIPAGTGVLTREVHPIVWNDRYWDARLRLREG